MLSTTASTSSKAPPLSYAERAKKAQNIKSPVSATTPTRIVSTSSTASTSTPSTSTAATSPVVRSTSSTSADGAGSPAGKLPEGSSSASPISSTTLSSAVAGAPLANGQLRPSTEPVSKQSSGQQSTPKPPVPNFWNTRKEQMAASRTAVSSSSSASANAGVANAGVAKSQSVTNSGISVPEKKIAVASSVDVASTPRSSVPPVDQRKSDPSIVRPSPSSTRMPPPPVPPSIDSEAWPEVGKSGQLDQQDGSFNQTSKEDASTAAAGGKKGEKPKWIPIPAEELQATADAMLKSSRPQSRRSSKGPSRMNPDSRSSNTRNQSGRNSTAQSTSQSRVQSRAGSLQSSPRFSRGRRLPGDEGYGQTSRPNGIQPAAFPPRSPRPVSPLVVNSNPQPILPPQPSGSNEPVNIPHVYPVSQNSSISPHPYIMYPPAFPGLPPHIPPGTQYPASTSQNGSPSMQPHPIPPLPYPHVIPSYPIYPMYGPPYDYSGNAGPPPLFWNGVPPPRSGQHTPAYPPEPVTYPFSPEKPPIPVNGIPVTAAKSPLFVSESIVQLRPSEAAVPPSALPEKPSPGDKPVIFGTIGIALSEVETPLEHGSSIEPRAETLETSFARFSIGVSPDELAQGRRSRTRSSKGRSRTETTNDASASGITIDVSRTSGDEGNSNPIMEGAGNKWEFGTTNTLAPFPVDEAQLPTALRLSPMSDSISAAQLPLEPAMPVPVTVPIPIPAPLVDQPIPDIEADFKVKNFGYGFGQGSGSIVPVQLPTVDPLPVGGEFEGTEPYGVKPQRYQEQRSKEPEAFNPVKPPRRFQEQNVDDAPPPTGQYKGRRSFNTGPHERGGHGGRRGGRGSSNGSGYGPRGQGRTHHRSNSFQAHPPRQQPSISVTPPPFQQPLMHPSDSPTNYYAMPRPHMPPYLPPPGYDAFALPPAAPPVPPPGPHISPPVPVPTTILSFPLDPTRYYLLGQLEYYLSPQNMAQDFFLRQRMDSRGWIPIPLIASFNRVRRLTLDVNLVREVLCLSTVVQVQSNQVRMSGWESFVLPDAAPSVVDEGENFYSTSQNLERSTSQHSQPSIVVDATHNDRGSVGDHGHTGDEGEEEEDDVVFVMGKDS